jgi:hypothetical protein
MQLDLAFTYPRFAFASVDARMRSLDKRYFPAEREVFAELAVIFERISETARADLPALYDELSRSGQEPGHNARFMAADALDRALDELEGREHVPN